MVVNALTKTGKWILYLLAALIILIALLAASIRLAVFYSEDYSEELAGLVSSYVGSPVEIGEIDLVWNRFDANASLKDVQVRSADGAGTLLELPEIELQLNVRDILLQRRLSVRSVELNNLSLEASYEGQGRLRMLGKQLRRRSAPDDKSLDKSLADSNQENDSQGNASIEKAEDIADRGHSVLSWLFNAERISILDSDITLVDALKNREYKVDNVNIRAFNDGDVHQIRVSNALPGDIGENSLASFDFTGQADSIDEWNGQFYVNTKGLNIAELSELWREPQQTYAGLADVQVWGAWNGTRINKMRVIATATELALQQPSSTGTFNTSIEADQLDVDLDWFRLDSGWQLTFNRLLAQPDSSEVRLDGLEMQVTRNSGEKYFSITGPDIDLQSLRPLFSFADAMLPNDLPIRTHALRRGMLTDWQASGILSENKNALTELRFHAVDLTVDPFDKTPGIGDLTASVVFEDGVGRVSIDDQIVSLALPELYEAPLPAISIDGAFGFLVNSGNDASDAIGNAQRVKANATSANPGSANPGIARPESAEAASGLQWKIVTEDFRLASRDFETVSAFSMSGFSDGSTLLDSHTSILNANIARLKDYLPTRIIKPKLRNWLQTAIVDGDAVRGRVEVKGDLSDFSPANGKGHFYAEADLVDTTLKFRPDWPAATAMDGNVSFSTTSMRGRVYQGSIREADFSDARLFLPNFRQAILEIQANAIGPVVDMLDFAQTGPLAPRIGKIFGNSTGSGTSRLALDLRVPLKKELREMLVVDGEMILDNAQISSSNYGIDLESVTGKLGFNRQGVTVDDMLVRYQGLPLAVNAIQESNAKNNTNRIRISGPVALASVMQSYGIPLVDQFAGTSNWNIDIDVTRPVNSKKARVELTASSDLAGTALLFPVPLNKSSNELREAKVYRDFGVQEKDWWVELPGLMKARVRAGADSKLESMAIALGSSENHVLPWRGIALHGDTHRLDASGWVRLALGFKSKEAEEREAFPLFAKISTDQMAIGEKVFDDLVYIAYRDGANQVHRVESSMLSGEFSLRQNRRPTDPLVLTLDRLDKKLLIALGETGKAKRTTGEVTIPLADPRNIPPLDIRVSELIWDNWRFSKVAMRTEPHEQGMQITALSARQNSMRVSGRGFWKHDLNAGVASHSTVLDLTASFDDFGLAMTEIANVNSFAGGSGEAALSLSWPSPAYAPDLNLMQGRLLFNLRDGRILSVQPGAGRILGLFALQSLPRRLTFDFRDLTDNGLEYSGVGGNLSIANGQAHTNAIAMSGPVAEILIHGSTGFVDKTYDQTIDVLPRVSGALPLLGVLSGGPAAGITALLADGVLKGIGVNLDEIGRRRYSLTGSWLEPIWKTVNVTTRSETSR